MDFTLCDAGPLCKEEIQKTLNITRWSERIKEIFFSKSAKELPSLLFPIIQIILSHFLAHLTHRQPLK